MLQNYENILSAETCDKIIRLFDQQTSGTIDDKITLYLSKSNEPFLQLLSKSLQIVIHRYLNDYISIDGTIPSYFNITTLEKKPNNLCFKKQTVRQKPKNALLTYLLFLNEVEVGGEIEFMEGIKTKFKQGTLVMFPSNQFNTYDYYFPKSCPAYIVKGYVLFNQERRNDPRSDGM